MQWTFGVAAVLTLGACRLPSESLGPGSPDSLAEPPGSSATDASAEASPDAAATEPGSPDAQADASTSLSTDASVDSPDVPAARPDSDAGLCLPGATQADCDLCREKVWSIDCPRACPKVDCSQYPVPAECAEVCAGAPCCSCKQPSAGSDDYRVWTMAQVLCGTECSGLRAKYKKVWADPRMTACTTPSDCSFIGAAFDCDAVYSLTDCGLAGNWAAYNASEAPALERQFKTAGCKDKGMSDCGGPGQVDCVEGLCTVTAWSSDCSAPPRDAGLADSGW